MKKYLLLNYKISLIVHPLNEIKFECLSGENHITITVKARRDWIGNWFLDPRYNNRIPILRKFKGISFTKTVYSGRKMIKLDKSYEIK